MNDLAELNTLPCAVIITDPGGAVLFINQWAQTAFGLTAAALPDRLEQLLPRAGQIFLPQIDADDADYGVILADWRVTKLLGQ